MTLRLIVIFCTATLTAACASTNPTSASDQTIVPNPYFAEVAQQTSANDKDRAAIRAMRGDYRVSFHFQETVPLKAGYERRDDKSTGGYETVIVVADSPEKIVLQHILVAPSGHVTKHWRQDWVHQAKTRFAFVADQTWATENLNPDVSAGTWTQCVYEVSDAPRYCGTGRWNHRYGVSTWTSDRTWRPLPRREYTTRSDYNAINGENRHTVTPNGWTHEQDNTKTVREGREPAATLVREFGFNDYRPIEGYDFSPAVKYWNNTADYWALVRGAWDHRLRRGNALSIDTNVDGMPIIEGTFAQAEQSNSMSEIEQIESIEALLDKWTHTNPRITLNSQRR